MKCADPVLCYISGNKKKYVHFSLATPIAKVSHSQVFICGKCISCRKKKSYELAMRCVLHASLYKKNCFLTLTYDETKEGYHNNLEYSDIQKFKKRLRKSIKEKIQIFNVHEYGKQGKKHWHLIVFNHDFPDKTLFTVKNQNNLYTSKKLEKLWPFGFNTIGDVSEASAMYQAQYMEKDLNNGNSNNEKKSKSNHSGIGRDYFLKNYKQILLLGFIPIAGKKLPIPRYYYKLAHRHWSHYYEPDNFRDFSFRKKIYRPFKEGQAIKEIADTFAIYQERRKLDLDQLKIEWEQSIDDFLFNKNKTDFQISNENKLYDLQKNQSTQRF